MSEGTLETGRPRTGAKWSLPDIMSGTSNFMTMIGDFEADGPTPFLREMSLHFYRLPQGVEDKQRPHREDEIYYVLSGSRTLQIVADGNMVDVPLTAGELVFVPAYAHHKFVGDEEISLLVFFAPNYSGHPE